MVSQRNPEINLITIKLETVSHVAEKFSWVSFPCCSPSGYPFPIKAFALSARVSPHTIHLRVLDQSLLLGPGKGPPSCDRKTSSSIYRKKLMNTNYCALIVLDGKSYKEEIKYSFCSYEIHREIHNGRLSAGKELLERKQLLWKQLTG